MSPTDTIHQIIASDGSSMAVVLAASFAIGACVTVALGAALDRRDARHEQQRLARSVERARRNET